MKDLIMTIFEYFAYVLVAIVVVSILIAMLIGLLALINLGIDLVGAWF